MRIRVAQYFDKDKILKFCKDTFEWGDYIAIVLDFWLTDPSGILLVVDIPDSRTFQYEPVAISHISVCQKGLLWIEGIRVGKVHRNKGIATHLLQYMVKYGIKNGLCESCALVSYDNIISKKLFEKYGFSQSCIYAYYNVEIKKRLDYSVSHILIKYACFDDINLICAYLNNSKFYLEKNNKYFNNWKFYKLENTFNCIYNLIDSKKFFLILDENSTICGLSIINILDDVDAFYNKPLLQVCYLDCLNYRIYSKSIYLILDTLFNYNKHKNVQIFVNGSIDLHHLFDNNDNYNVDTFEKFIVYCKKL